MDQRERDLLWVRTPVAKASYDDQISRVTNQRAKAQRQKNRGTNVALAGALAAIPLGIYGRTGGIKALKGANKAGKLASSMHRELGSGRLRATGARLRTSGSALRERTGPSETRFRRGLGTVAGVTGASGAYGGGSAAAIHGANKEQNANAELKRLRAKKARA